MFQRQRNWWTEVIWKPKKAHSLEQLRYHHYILTKNAVVTDQNRALLVETLRSIAEILIWGDQNDSTVFDFFLEKNMLLFFIKILNQNPGTYVCVQLLQTLNILFENIRHETSLYYLLSNNHVNSIIIHKFDFTNEEILAYYISFLKTLSLKLNRHVINFFFNERKNDFALYTEALKFFDHKESMVRIAVRTLTLNVCKVNDKAMLNFIVNKTADPYFCNLIWFIGNHAIELEDCARSEHTDHLHCGRLKDLVADHLDHLHYINDILCLNIWELNEILTEYLLDRLLIPLYIYSLVQDNAHQIEGSKPSVSKLLCLYLLSQIFLIMRYPPLLSTLTDVICQGEEIDVTSPQNDSPLSMRKSLQQNGAANNVRTFAAPEDTLEESLLASGINNEGYTITNRLSELTRQRSRHVANSKFYTKDRDGRNRRRRADEKQQETASPAHLSPVPMSDSPLGQSSTGDDDDGDGLMLKELKGASGEVKGLTTEESPIPNNVRIPNYGSPVAMSLLVRPRNFQPSRLYFNQLIKSLDCSEDDSEALFTICLIHSLLKNQGVDCELLGAVGILPGQPTENYDDDLIRTLIKIMEQASSRASKVRLVTLQLSMILLKQLVYNGHPGEAILKDCHLAFLESVRESSTLQLRNYYKSDDDFLDMFEGEYRQMKVKPLNVERLMMDASLLLPPTVTPLTGIEFSKRLACGEVEHTQRAIRVFLMVRELSLTVRREPERQLPLSKVEYSVKENEVLDLNNSDLISCTIVDENRTLRRFLVIDEAQFILVEPDTTRLGWGVVKFVALLQDVETSPAKDDSRSLFITIHQPFARSTRGPRPPVMSAKFMFDDYIRCMSAKQRLHRRRTSLRHIKLQRIAQLLELPVMAAPPSQPYYPSTPTFVHPSFASPQGIKSRPGAAVPVASPVPPGDISSAPVVDNIPRPAGVEENTCARSDDVARRMAAPESCLHPSQTSGGQARALANLLEDDNVEADMFGEPANDFGQQMFGEPANNTDQREMCFGETTNNTGQRDMFFEPADNTDQRETVEADDVIEEASDVLDGGMLNDDDIVSEPEVGRPRPLKCPSAPATPRGMRRIVGNSEFHVVEWTVGDLTGRNALSEPSLLLEMDRRDDSSDDDRR